MEMNIGEFLTNVAKMNELMKKFEEAVKNDPAKRPLLDGVMMMTVQFMNAIFEYSEAGESFIVNFVGKKKGQAPATVNFSMIEHLADEEYIGLMQSLQSVTMAIIEYQNLERSKKMQPASGVTPAEAPKSTPKPFDKAEVIKKEDGGIEIKFN